MFLRHTSLFIPVSNLAIAFNRQYRFSMYMKYLQLERSMFFYMFFILNFGDFDASVLFTDVDSSTHHAR